MIQPELRSLTCCTVELESATSSVKVAVPELVGVPEILALLLVDERVRPLGREPEEIRQL